MCGIVGMLNLDGAPVDPDLLRRMTRLLDFRGPDGEGCQVSGPVGLGHRRLSVIDLAGGRQPMGNEDGNLCLVSNSEIYNYRDLRADLVRRGHRFRTNSDTEVIVHLYEEQGPRCVEALRGMFALALWDERNRSLFLARDRLGQKPLYVARTGSAVLFASLPDPLFLHPGLEPVVDPEALDLYLSLLYVPGPRSIYRDVRKLAPAHWMLCTPEGIQEHCYWRLHYLPKRRGSVDAAAGELGERLEEAVRVRLMSDVPLGSLLSGGLDSSLVTAIAVREGGRPLKTFSIGSASPRHDEVPYALRVSRMLGTEHRVCFFHPDRLEVLDELLPRCPEPLADPSLLPLYALSRRVRQEVTVVLSGDAGDENLAGYDRYLYARLARLFQRGTPDPAGPRRTGSVSRSRWSKFRRFLDLPEALGHLHQFDQMGGLDRSCLYTGATLARIPDPRPSQAYFSALFSRLSPEKPWLDRLLAADVHSYLAWDILPKVDTATMAHGLECRSPFLDHPFMEFAARLPHRYKLRGLTRKYILKRYGQRWLPPEIVHRRKTGFSLPLSAWFRGEWGDRVRALLDEPEARSAGLFRPGAVGSLVDEHRSGGTDRAYLLWALFILENWLRAHPAACFR